VQVRPRKRFGQHFLHDPAIIGRILAALDAQPGEAWVEIGPGLGAITAPLLERIGVLHAVELDRDLIQPLRERCAGLGTLHVHQGDALRFDYCALAATMSPPAVRLRLVGNLPYYISTPLLFYLLDQTRCVQDMHFMLQREVVDRMIAAPGSKRYGRLTVMLAARCRVEALFRIAAGAFRPAPRVESAYARITPWADPPFSIEDPDLFARIVTLAFSRRRKTLRNALAGLIPAQSMVACDIDPGARPETLSPAQFAALARTDPGGSGILSRDPDGPER
jgi:16S rRNA (adenine1518-N6/adenine1519-N6)-dimethyltransferase